MAWRARARSSPSVGGGAAGQDSHEDRCRGTVQPSERRASWNPWLATLIILGAAALSAAGMLTVRRRAPAGTFFKDPIPGAAVYTVAGTAYMVILAFVFFIAFESYGGAKADAEEEATATLAMFHAAGPFAPAARAELQGQMICYAREVISDGWPALREGGGSPVVDARVSAM